MKKRIVSILLVISALLTVISVSVFATEPTSGTCGEHLLWTLQDGVLTISGTGDMEIGDDGWGWNDYQEQITSVVVMDGVTSIYNTAFAYSSNLESVEIAGSVKSIGSWVFDSCSSLKQVTLHEGLESIDFEAFARCTSLETIQLPTTVKEISGAAFFYCTSLKEIHIPAEAQINYFPIYGAFGYSESMQRFTVDEKNPYYCALDGVLYSKDMKTLLQIPGGKSSVEVPDGVEAIEDGAAYGATGLNSISLPDSLLSIGFSAFESSGLTQIVIPDSVTYLGPYAFSKCDSLIEAIVGSGVTTIDCQTFGTCSHYAAELTVRFTGDIQTICEGAFSTKNVTVYYPAGSATWTEDLMQDYWSDSIQYIPYVAPFFDVEVGKFYSDSIPWAFTQNITTGITSTAFEPKTTCTRGQVVTFLWRALGSPKPGITDCDFVDVKADKYYYDAMLWAVENNVTTGIDATHFAPNDTVTRGQFVTFLWRALGKPESTENNPFTDVRSDSFYTQAVLWAAETGVTSGSTPTQFQPGNPCTRGQVVTFLYRAMA